jgi:hypothetical protein
MAAEIFSGAQTTASFLSRICWNRNLKPNKVNFMKKAILAFLLCCAALFQVRAADEPLIPAALNKALPKIHPGMTANQVVAILLPSYPKVAVSMGDWSGGSGYIDYKLDDRFTLSVSSITRDGKDVVHDDILFYLFDWPSKRRVDIRIYDWGKQPPKASPQQ